MRKLNISILSIILFALAVLPAKAALTDFEQKSLVSVEVYKNYGDRAPIQQGSGFFIDYTGCVLTSAHILYNNSNLNEVFNYIRVSIFSDIRQLSKDKRTATIKFIDRKRDLAVICIDNDGGAFFHPFQLLEKGGYEKLNIGLDVVTTGFPQIGGKTPTYSFGKLIGFWNQPDLKEFLKMDRFEDKDIYLIKIDAVSGPGASGSPTLNENDEVIGVVFAASLSPGGITFLISSKTIHQVLQEQIEKERQAVGANLNCHKNENGLYERDGIFYYDHTCQSIQNLKIEDIVKLNYTARCFYEPTREIIYQATKYISSGKGTIDLWWSYLTELCPLGIEESAEKQKGNTSLLNKSGVVRANLSSSNNFSYGLPRVSSLSQETEAANELKLELEKIMGKGKITVSAKNWNTLVNSYLYGGYSVKAIYKGIKFGGYTVHPTINYAKWKNSNDYLAYINR